MPVTNSVPSLLINNPLIAGDIESEAYISAGGAVATRPCEFKLVAGVVMTQEGLLFEEGVGLIYDGFSVHEPYYAIKPKAGLPRSFSLYNSADIVVSPRQGTFIPVAGFPATQAPSTLGVFSSCYQLTDRTGNVLSCQPVSQLVPTATMLPMSFSELLVPRLGCWCAGVFVTSAVAALANGGTQNLIIGNQGTTLEIRMTGTIAGGAGLITFKIPYTFRNSLNVAIASALNDFVVQVALDNGATDFLLKISTPPLSGVTAVQLLNGLPAALTANITSAAGFFRSEATSPRRLATS
jgi:hypothetical protein